MTNRTLSNWIFTIVGVVVLAGCSATASETDTRSLGALSASPTPNGGVLACSATHNDTPGGMQVRSVILFSNDNDEGSIHVDRVLVYARDGQLACTIPNPMVLAPHQMGSLLTAGLTWCLPQGGSGGAGKVRFVVYWSREGHKSGNLNPLDGWSEITTSDSSLLVLAKLARDCKAITLPPDRCAGVTCRTVDVCGQQAPCEVCVDGKCVTNTPHFDPACVPSCGAANSFCGTAAECGFMNGQCLPSWDCSPGCCTQP